MLRICQKCSHPNPSATGAELEACPACGAIYTRVAAALAANSRAPSASPSAAGAAPHTHGETQEGAGSLRDFARHLRANSLYPSFRELVRLIYIVWVVFAGLALLGALSSLVWGSGVVRVGAFLSGIFFALFFFVIARVSREAALMLADLSDAAVHLASRSKP